MMNLLLFLALLQSPATVTAASAQKETAYATKDGKWVSVGEICITQNAKIAWLEEKVKRQQRLIDATSGILSTMPQMREYIEAQQSLMQHEAAKPKEPVIPPVDSPAKPGKE